MREFGQLPYDFWKLERRFFFAVYQISHASKSVEVNIFCSFDHLSFTRLLTNSNSFICIVVLLFQGLPITVDFLPFYKQLSGKPEVIYVSPDA